jgi:predicted AlkP superfamily pyrophosphatase or phosphodiesterase
MKFRTLAAILALCALAAGARAQPTSAPKLIVAISVDQFSADLFAQYRQHFTGGLRRLSQGVVFPSGFQSHAATETCPGHSTILTGSRPARTGIVANNWYNLDAARPDKNVYCAEDERVPGSSSANYTASPFHLRVPTLGEHMRQADPRSRAVIVAGKDRAAMMLGGQAPTQRWYRGGDIFVTDLDLEAAPAAVTEVNRDAREALATARAAMPVPAVCAPHVREIALEGGRRAVGAYLFARAAGDGGAFSASPEYDRLVLALARRLRDELRLGQGETTDLLAIGLSATDYVGHIYGTQGAEMCLQVMALDAALGEFFADLDRTGVDYLVMLTADHGGHDVPERIRQQAAPDAARIDPALNSRRVGSGIAQRLGLAIQPLIGDATFGDLYVSRDLPGDVRRRVLDEAVSAYRAHPQVAAVFTREEILAVPPLSGPPDAWTLIERTRASYHPERSGDFLVLLRPRVTPIADPSRGYTATHGSPWDYDRRVPILFWRRGLTPFEQPLAVETVDILPTLAALIGVTIPGGTIDGRCLDLIEGPATSCGR